MVGGNTPKKTIKKTTKPQQLNRSQRRLITLFSSSQVGVQPALHSPIRVNIQNLAASIRRLMRQTDYVARTVPISFEEESESAARYSLPQENMTITSIETVEKLRKLPVCQLKHLLKQNQINFKNTYERGKLVELAERLWYDKYQPMERVFDNTCKVCMNADIDCVILDCRHEATCFSCAKRLKKCPICRQSITTRLKTFRQ